MIVEDVLNSPYMGMLNKTQAENLELLIARPYFSNHDEMYEIMKEPEHSNSKICKRFYTEIHKTQKGNKEGHSHYEGEFYTFHLNECKWGKPQGKDIITFTYRNENGIEVDWRGDLEGTYKIT